MLTVIVDHVKQGREALKTLGYHEKNVKTRSRREIELENGNRIIAKPPRESAIRGWKPDLIILRCDVTDSFYHRILEPCVGTHGVIIDER